MTRRLLMAMICGVLAFEDPACTSAQTAAPELFADRNLVAWCIVPFDSKKRGPEERAAMLEKLGFTKFAYDYRAEHIPTFDAEIEALKRHHVELTAWWFPTSLNDEAKMTLAVFEKHKVTPQLWVTGGGAPTKSDQEQQQRIKDEAARIRPIAEAAAKVGCKVALYNHGGWFGEPENQIAIIRELNLPNVGIVYNQHHGHDHLERFPELLKFMKPYLYVLNLNGMVVDGERKGQKILQLSQGDLDLKLLKVIRDSGYTGPIGILGHTQDDAEERLRDNLDGLRWLLPQLDGKPAGPKPKMRTPIPAAQAAAAPAANPIVARLAEGKFGKAIDGRAGGAFVSGREQFHQFPITVECWTKLTDKGPYNILVANELKSSGTHWELFSMAGDGNFTVYTPGFTPDHCRSNAMICDGQWHYVAMILEPERVRLFVDGRQATDQACRRTTMESVPGHLALAGLVDKQIGCTGLVDEVRISREVRSIASIPNAPFSIDESTLALWHLDELVEQKRFDDATKKSPALVDVAMAAPSGTGKRPKIEGHWGEDALGFRWTENDSRDDRFGQMDTGPFFSGSITGPGGTVFKGVVVRVGSDRSASVCYDTELMRASAGWTGFVKFDAARYGIIVPPTIDGPVTFTTPLLGGWTRTDQLSNFRDTSPYGGLPKTEAHYEGLYRHGQRVVLKFTVGMPADSKETGKVARAGPESSTWILESPWIETAHEVSAISRTLLVGPSTTPLKMLVADEAARVHLLAPKESASIEAGPRKIRILVVPPHMHPVPVKLLIAAPGVDADVFAKLAAASPPPEDLTPKTKGGPSIWGAPLETVGEISKDSAAFAVDTITLPFENPFRALMFCGGHDFLPDGRAFICTLHGDVWLVDGIDESLQRITWRRFATGLFQPLGVKLVPTNGDGALPGFKQDLYVVGRDQITRLRDLNGDGEADSYQNFNNDAYVTLNGHEYVTCLETDRAGNFFYVKGNCDSATPHDGSLLRVSPDGSTLDVFATGFRNPNGLTIGPNDQITIAPQEGEWTPASAVFDVHQGGFYGGMMSHHQKTPPKDFERPFCWFPRLADNSCGGQVWIPADRWGPLAGQLLHLSYGQCKLRMMLREDLPTSASSTGGSASTGLALQRSPLVRMNGGSTELSMSFASGIHRGRFNLKDGHLYLTGLKGWVTSAANDGCFQRVRYTGQRANVLVGMKTYRNGVTLTFTDPLNREEVEDIDSYQIEAWNYHWSAAYGSPDLKLSAPGQLGRDAIEPKSVTLLDDNQSLFLELPDLKPCDQLGISYSLRSTDGKAIEQTAYVTLNGIPDRTMPESQLHRSQQDVERAELLARLLPGVVLTADSSPTSIHSRLLAWSKPRLANAGGPLTASGYLKVPATGEYRFSIEPQEAAHGLRLNISGQTVSLQGSGSVVRVRKGLTTIQVFPLSAREETPFRLMWQSNQFPRESIPATAIFHQAFSDDVHQQQERIHEGRVLFAKYQCGRCHTNSDSAVAALRSGTEFEQQRHAPRLQGIGSRVSPDWLAAWLQNPRHLRADATMPKLASTDAHDVNRDLVAYLISLRDDLKGLAGPGHQTATGQDDKNLENGANLFERLGCIACHTFAEKDPTTEWNRISLHFVNAKFLPGQLYQFLKSPHRFHDGSHMPDFHLTDDEVHALTAHIEANSKGQISSQLSIESADLGRGQKLFSEMKCDRCHEVSANQPLAKADVRFPFSNQVKSGCPGHDDQPRQSAPRFRLSERERDCLQRFLVAVEIKDVSALNGVPDVIPRAITSLRCTACHAYDSTSALWPEVVADEGSGNLTETVPPLTLVGEKLQGPWIAKLLSAELKQKPRPWITARMPSFPKYAQIISHGLADQHGVAYEEPFPREFDSDRIDLGRQLTMRDGGLDCRQCHGIGKELPHGDVKTQIALGINFAMVRDRLRPEFVMRQLFDPPRYDIGSRMPRFAPDLKTTAAKHLADGDAAIQFDSLKQYLLSLEVKD